MPTLEVTPDIAALGPQRTPQICYVLVTVGVDRSSEAQPINWAFVADASRSMRIPIVDEAQFRALVRSGGAQETLVDGVPVWQLTAPLPPEVRAATKSPLDYVAHALHAILERLDNADRFALVACAESAEVLRSAPGDARAELAQAIARLLTLRLGDETDLARGMELALDQLRRGHSRLRIDRMLLLTDGFTRDSDRCLQLAEAAAGQGIAISTIGLGGEFQEDLLTALADRSGGNAMLVRHVEEIAGAVANELRQARRALALNLGIEPRSGTILRRITRIQPTLAVLHEDIVDGRVAVPIGEKSAFVLEALVPAELENRAAVLDLALANDRAVLANHTLTARRYAQPPALPDALRQATAQANIARLHKRALDANNIGQHAEAARLFELAAQRLAELGANELAQRYRDQAVTIAQPDTAQATATKELTYATRRLGERKN